MNSLLVKKYLKSYMMLLVSGNMNKFWESNSLIIEELSIKLSKRFKKEKEIEEYLDYILVYIDNLNQFFSKSNSGRIPYSKMFSFANKEERLQEFLLDRSISHKIKNKSSRIAGHEISSSENEINIIYKDEIYGQIYSSSVNDFFFSVAIKKLVVRNKKSGNIVSYLTYVGTMKKKKFVFFSEEKIYKALKFGDNRTNTMQSFIDFYEKGKCDD